MDPDQRFEYIIASIKRDTRRQQSGLKTSTMQVILKRQPRAGIDMQGPPFTGFSSIRLPSGGFLDLLDLDKDDRSSMICWDSDQFGARPGMNTFERHLSEPWVHVDQPEMRPSIPHAHSYRDQAIFGEEGHDVKYGQEDRSDADLFENSVGVGTSNVHDGRDDVRSSFGDVSVGHDVASRPIRLNAPHFSCAPAPSPPLVEIHNDQSPIYGTNFGQPSPRFDGTHHGHPNFGEEGHDVKHGQEELPPSQARLDLSILEYHYNWTDDLQSLSSGTTNRSWNKQSLASQSVVALQR